MPSKWDDWTVPEPGMNGSARIPDGQRHADGRQAREEMQPRDHLDSPIAVDDPVARHTNAASNRPRFLQCNVGDSDIQDRSAGVLEDQARRLGIDGVAAIHREGIEGKPPIRSVPGTE